MDDYFMVDFVLKNKDYNFNGWKLLSAWYNFPLKIKYSPGILIGLEYSCALERNFK